MDDSTQPTMEPVDPTPAAPASAWVQPMEPYANGRLPMPGSVVGAAVVLLVLGVLTLLMAAAFVMSGSLYQQLPNSTFNGLDPAEMDRIRNFGRGFALGFGGVAGVIAICHLASGVGIFRRASWARVMGMVMAGLGMIFTGLIAVVFLIGLSGGMPIGNVEGTNLTPAQMEQAIRAGFGVGLAIFGVGLLAYLFTLVALIRNGRVFN
jgi:hypothetical protein